MPMPKSGRVVFTGAAAVAVSLALATTAGPAAAGPADRPSAGGPRLERLDRGLVAAATSQGVFLSWRLLGEEVTGAGDGGLRGPAFRVYRDGRLIATVTDSTNYLDPAGTASASYRVAPGRPGPGARRRAGGRLAWSEDYVDLPLRKPADGVTPAGEAYTYAANDMSVGDVDGDGPYEYVVKWDPSNSKDVSQVGYTGPVFIDTYEADGTLLHRIDLGVNIRAGAHYTQFLVYDFDGDGRSEMMLKTAPGTKMIRYDAAGRVRLRALHHDATRGRAGRLLAHRRLPAERGRLLRAPGRRCSSAGTTTRRWWRATGRRRWRRRSASRRGTPTRCRRRDAAALADYFIDVYAPARSTRNVLRAFEGFIVDGPEYLTVFDGPDRPRAADGPATSPAGTTTA